MSTDDVRILINNLERLGFFDHVAKDRIGAVKAQVTQSQDPFQDETGLVYFVDAERLVESGIGELLKDIGDFLHSEGVMLESVEEHCVPGEHYSVTIERHDYKIWQRPVDQQGDLWSRASLATFRMLNDLLKKADSKYSLYHGQIGNDTLIVFLTKEMYDAIAKSDVSQVVGWVECNETQH